MLSDLLSDSVRAAGLGAVMKGAGLVVRFIPIPQPTLLVGPARAAPGARRDCRVWPPKILIVTDGIISKLGLLRPLTDALTAGGANYVVFDEITPDAPIPDRKKGASSSSRCTTAMRLSRLAADRRWMPRRRSPWRWPTPSRCGTSPGTSRVCSPVKIYAVPTTAGTGSEVTVAAVISDPEAGKKMVIVDPRLVPKWPRSTPR